jgi:hypothetical protein
MYDEGFIGRIDQIQIHDVALTSGEVQAVPEPGRLVLLLSGALGLAAFRRRGADPR